MLFSIHLARSVIFQITTFRYKDPCSGSGLRGVYGSLDMESADPKRQNIAHNLEKEKKIDVY
jgi:hypothetical protein